MTSRREGCEGVVILEVLLPGDGSVQEPKVLRGLSPACDEAAKRVVTQWRFEPAVWVCPPYEDRERGCSLLPGDPAAVSFTVTHRFLPPAPR